jgi:hypothetical protein
VKKLIYIYLLTINLQNIILRIIYGPITGGFHPGIIIKGGVLIALVIYYLDQLSKGLVPKNMFTYSILFALIIYFLQIIVVEIGQFDFQFLGQSFSYSVKIFLYVFITYFVFKNHIYFISKLDNILLFNVVVVLINIILSYYFQIGWKSYEAIEDSYRGFMAGNDTSIFSFVSFGYGLYLYKKKKFLSALIIVSSAYAMYIIATKAIFVAGIILFLFLMFGLKLKMKYVFLPLLIVVSITMFSQIDFSNSIVERLFLNYNSSLAKSDVFMEAFAVQDSFVLDMLNNVAPGRIIIGVAMVVKLFTDNIINMLLGYGVGGIFVAFGRPPMMDILMILGVYGVLGFFALYWPLLRISAKLIKSRDFDLVGVLFFTVFLYGSLGGFLLGTAGTNSIFALLFGIMISRYYKSNVKKIVGCGTKK